MKILILPLLAVAGFISTTPSAPTDDNSLELNARSLVNLEKRCISDGRSCPQDRPELCCSGKCVWTWFSGPLCTYSTASCRQPEDHCETDEQCCSGGCIITPDRGSFCDGAEVAGVAAVDSEESKTTSIETIDPPKSKEDNNIKHMHDDKTSKDDMKLDEVEIVPRSDLEKRCITDGRSCPQDRPELCCSGKCIWTWFSGPICSYSTTMLCIQPGLRCTIDEQCCSGKCQDKPLWGRICNVFAASAVSLDSLMEDKMTIGDKVEDKSD